MYRPRSTVDVCAPTPDAVDMIANVENARPMAATSGTEKIVIRDSLIHGRGVFATQRLEPGHVIIDGCRQVLSDDAVAALPPEEREFISVMNGRNVLMKPPSRFVNHSCNPNACGTDEHDVAVRVIEAGEEITVDYADEVPGLMLECNCKAANCRRVIPPRTPPDRG